jgi:prepilin-type N-terminal cleavage/methylation domain-containing protein
MENNAKNLPLQMRGGFTLIELLVVIGIIGILAAIVIPVSNHPKSIALRAYCLNNLKQIDSAVHMYADDSKDKVAAPPGFYTSIEPWYRYKELVEQYLGRAGGRTPSDKLFKCPADTFNYSASGYHSMGECEKPETGYSSYIFNAGNTVGTNGYPGIYGKNLAVVKEPAKTVLVGESAAFGPWSWHNPQMSTSQYCFNDSKDVLSFVDGHVEYVKMYWSGSGEAWQYDPPAGYDYKWSGN